MSRLTWDVSKLNECRIARMIYQRMREEGYLCRQNGDPVTVFDAKTGEALFEKTPSRYDRLMEENDGADCFDP